MAKPHKGTSHEDRALKELETMKHRDLMRACIVRGLPFNEVLRRSDPSLAGWFTDNYIVVPNVNLLDEFDAWKDKKIAEEAEKKGEKFEPTHPMLRLGYIGEIDPDTGEAVIKRPKGIKKPKKKKRERDEVSNIYKGTKKALTYELTLKGETLEDIKKKVKAQFPEAVDKSIGIWHKRCIKEVKNKGKK